MIAECLQCPVFWRSSRSILTHLLVKHFVCMGTPRIRIGFTFSAPFARRAAMAQNEQAFNQSMSMVRVSVQWVFGYIANYFKFIDFKKNLKIGPSAVGKYYVICALLRNALTCLYGNNTSAYFQVAPPSLADYFQ